jgi:hypothetical protein
VGALRSHDPNVLRWYPPAWRRRYGEELMALLQDTYGDEPIPLRARLSLIQSGTRERVHVMRKRLNTYTAYSIGCAVVWAVILAVVSAETDVATRQKFLLIFGGWAIGWLSATIARVVYPPPKSRTRVDARG